MKHLLSRIKSRLIRSKPTPYVPVANKKDRILSLRSLFVPMNAVVDVGIQKMTSELISALPDKHHFLFEPVALWHEDIRNNYKSLDYTLFPIALSDQAGSAWLITSSLHPGGVATHAAISSEATEPDGKKIVGCSPIQINRLDSFGHLFGTNYLLKIDVDGKELEILRGASGCIHNASVVIVEADWSSLTQRGKILEDYGFLLIDIIDRVMYGAALWQCDLVYLRNDLMNESIRPPLFDSRYWHPLP